MAAGWNDSNNLVMVGYADKDELVTYSVTVRTWLPILLHSHSVGSAADILKGLSSHIFD